MKSARTLTTQFDFSLILTSHDLHHNPQDFSRRNSSHSATFRSMKSWPEWRHLADRLGQFEISSISTENALKR